MFKLTKEAKLENTKAKFRKTYQRYLNYLDQFEGKIPKAIENVKFGDDGIGGIDCN